jgi:hypothetical protein
LAAVKMEPETAALSRWYRRAGIFIKEGLPSLLLFLSFFSGFFSV